VKARMQLRVTGGEQVARGGVPRLCVQIQAFRPPFCR
jgi:hypothetical protein